MLCKCPRCNGEFNRKDIQEHHFIPKSIISKLNINDINPDLYRVLICKECHEKLSIEWNKILRKIGYLQNDVDNWFKGLYSDQQWNVINDMRLGHSYKHDEFNCKYCNRPMERLWIKQTIENGVDEGKRNLTRFKLISNMFRKGWKDEEITKKIMEFNSKCNPPDEERQVKYHVRYTLKRLRG